jgi:hypothetical protein
MNKYIILIAIVLSIHFWTFYDTKNGLLDILVNEGLYSESDPDIKKYRNDYNMYKITSAVIFAVALFFFYKSK